MPLYHHLIMALPRSTPEALTEVFRRYTKTVILNGGNIRAIENHGVRELPETTYRKFVTSDGYRKFDKMRYISAYIDASPAIVTEAQRCLNSEEPILRQFFIKVESGKDHINSKQYLNKYRHVMPEQK